MNAPLHFSLPRPAPARVLACGAFLKNTACLIDGSQVWISALHGDLSDPQACADLRASVAELTAKASAPIEAVAHDLHPDFFSTRLALELAAEWGVPAIAVQHHHAHIAVLQAEHGLVDEALTGLALDGVGLGLDGTAWGGEVLRVQRGESARVAHLPLLALPGGDVAAREPWRLAAALLHGLGRGDEIGVRFAPLVGADAAHTVAAMLSRDLNCPRSSAAGRWFDAAAGALGLSLRQSHEAEAAQALELVATTWLECHSPAELPSPSLDLLPLAACWLGTARERDAVGEAAALFHLALAAGLVDQARKLGLPRVALGGGCFFNRLLRSRVVAGLAAAGLKVLQPGRVNCGDAGLAFGQAWAAALQLQFQQET
jgi:hydrogenase maturation protein HypF